MIENKDLEYYVKIILKKFENKKHKKYVSRELFRNICHSVFIRGMRQYEDLSMNLSDVEKLSNKELYKQLSRDYVYGSLEYVIENYKPKSSFEKKIKDLIYMDSTLDATDEKLNNIECSGFLYLYKLSILVNLHIFSCNDKLFSKTKDFFEKECEKQGLKNSIFYIEILGDIRDFYFYGSELFITEKVNGKKISPQPEKAIAYIHEAIEIEKKNFNTKELYCHYFDLSRAYFESKQYNKALENIDIAIDKCYGDEEWLSFLKEKKEEYKNKINSKTLN
jgi:tetratricopeptide (TPR) repeat protein